MDDIDIIGAAEASIGLRPDATGHVFTYRVDSGDLVPGPVKEGPGPKDQGDVAADGHAVAKRDVQIRGLI